MVNSDLEINWAELPTSTRRTGLEITFWLWQPTRNGRIAIYAQLAWLPPGLLWWDQLIYRFCGFRLYCHSTSKPTSIPWEKNQHLIHVWIGRHPAVQVEMGTVMPMAPSPQWPWAGSLPKSATPERAVTESAQHREPPVCANPCKLWHWALNSGVEGWCFINHLYCI